MTPKSQKWMQLPRNIAIGHGAIADTSRMCTELKPGKCAIVVTGRKTRGIAVENMPRIEFIFGKEPAEMAGTIELVGRGNLGMTLDVGHAHTNSVLSEFLGMKEIVQSISGKVHNIAYTFLVQNFSPNLFTFSPILYS